VDYKAGFLSCAIGIVRSIDRCNQRGYRGTVESASVQDLRESERRAADDLRRVKMQPNGTALGCGFADDAERKSVVKPRRIIGTRLVSVLRNIISYRWTAYAHLADIFFHPPREKVRIRSVRDDGSDSAEWQLLREKDKRKKGQHKRDICYERKYVFSFASGSDRNPVPLRFPRYEKMK